MKRETLPFVTTRNLEGIMLRKVSQAEEDKYDDFARVWALKKSQTHSNRADWCLSGAGGWGRGNVDQRVQTSSYKMNTFWGPNTQHGESCSGRRS